MGDIDRFDEIRFAILKHLDEVMNKSRNVNMARETDVQIQRTLRDSGYEAEEVNQELLYMLEKRYVKKHTESGKSSFTKMSYKTTTYYISGVGRDYLHGESKNFRSTSLFGGININNIQGAVAIGENNVAIVHKSHLNLYQDLNNLKEAVLTSKEIDDEDKGEYVADIETIKNQVSKKNPNSVIVNASWIAIQGLSSIEGMIQLIERIKPLIEPFM